MTRYSNSSYQLASGTRNAFAALSADLVAEGHPEIQVNSGDREPADQIREFLKKFVPSSGPKDVGPYGDRREWKGHGWYKRVVGGGTVAPPGNSNHEARRAADLAYPYNSNTAAHRRAQVLAKRHNITCEGLGFSEWWHWTYWGPLGTIDQPGIPSGGANSTEEDDVVTKDDKDWFRLMTQQELAQQRDWQRLMTQQELAQKAGLTPDNQAWMRLMIQQENTPILRAIAALDPADPAAVADLERIMRESEQRQRDALADAASKSIEETRKVVEQANLVLRDEIARALSSGGVAPYADIRKAVDDAFDEVFVRPSES